MEKRGKEVLAHRIRLRKLSINNRRRRKAIEKIEALEIILDSVRKEYLGMKQLLEEVKNLQTKRPKFVEGADKKNESTNQILLRRIKHKDVPKLSETARSVWEVISFLGEFELEMLSYRVGEEEQKRLLTSSISPLVKFALGMKGGLLLPLKALKEAILEKVIGTNWKTAVRNNWGFVKQKQGEEISDFFYRVSLYLKWMDREPELGS